MTLSTEHHWTEELLGAYALDALDADQRLAVEDHLDECGRCRHEVDGHRNVAAALGHAVEPLPPELWDRIAAELLPGPMELPLLSLQPSPAPALHSESGAKIIRPARWRVLTAAAAAAAIAVIAVLSVSLANTNSELTSTRAALASTAGAADHSLTVSGHRVVQLASTTSPGKEIAKIVLLPNGHGYIVSNSLPSLTNSRTYQLWAIVGGTPISLGMLGGHPGAISFTIGTAKPTVLAVSVEPSHGSTAPSAMPIAAGAV